MAMPAAMQSREAHRIEERLDEESCETGERRFSIVGNSGSQKEEERSLQISRETGEGRITVEQKVEGQKFMEGVSLRKISGPVGEGCGEGLLDFRGRFREREVGEEGMAISFERLGTDELENEFGVLSVETVRTVVVAGILDGTL